MVGVFKVFRKYFRSKESLKNFSHVKEREGTKMKRMAKVLLSIMIMCLAFYPILTPLTQEVQAADSYPGLLLYNTLGSVDEIQNSEYGPDLFIEGTVDFAPARFGNGAYSTGFYTENRILVDYDQLKLSYKAGTVEAWVNFPKSPIVSPYSYSMFSLLDGYFQSVPGGDNSLGQQVENYIGDGVTGTLNTLYVTINFGTPVQVQIPNIDQLISPGENNHLAIAWDKEGIGNTGNTIQVYLNGEVIGFSNDNNWGTTPDEGNRHSIGKGESYAGNAFVIDNIKIYDFAKADFPEINIEDAITIKDENTLILIPSATTISAGSTIDCTIEVPYATDLYAIQATFIANKSDYLTPLAITYGDFFEEANRYEIPSDSSAPADRFCIAASLMNPAQPVTGSGTFASISYTVDVNAYGEVNISCYDVVFSNKNGMALNGSGQGAVFTIQHPIFEPDGETIIGFITLPPGVEADSAVITLENAHGDQVAVTVNTNGDFIIEDLKDGTYKIWADHKPYFSTCTEIKVVKGQVVNVDPIVMISGDINGDNSVDIGDVTLVAIYFEMTTKDIPKVDRGVDLNNDGIVNIQDLAIVGGNFGIERCH
ncbi:MAG: dockerin type I domain-containing protein [bacterium]